MSSPIDTNQPDHIVDMHEMVTDTNQASEDELHELAVKFDMDEYGTVNENGGYLIGEVRKLIRTEKLKLLAEVRERVVGEDEIYARVKDGIRIVGQSEKPRNELRTEQRIELTKLEAEL